MGENGKFRLYSALNQPLTSAGMKVTLLYMLEPLNATFEGTVVINENSSRFSPFLDIRTQFQRRNWLGPR